MSFFTIRPIPNHYRHYYCFTVQPSLNCFLFDFEGWESVRNNGPYILYIGSVWYDSMFSVANMISELALKYNDVKFGFTLVQDEMVLYTDLPESIRYHHLPLIVYIKSFRDIKLISNGPIHKQDLEDKVKVSLSKT